ncbi:hypothetical protein SOVF_052590 [Spinacia oleracea]|uniref:UPF0161 protein At3g09310 n=1 Tax=Spinacia oleracea TaxID=3562 RepID=A0A9R0IXU1_SPIOL|nr:UPF0161 protein At3g09310 [Spinacia oleracea]XP_021856939.1 UPF0161 protein At3g09310 [Spinacia oleracea]KNA20420.1 hypothetical protein SOVF_052590 [Spinacia oleracea]
MAAIQSLTFFRFHSSSDIYPLSLSSSPSLKFPKHIKIYNSQLHNFPTSSKKFQRRFSPILNKIEPDPDEEEEVQQSTGVKAALSMLNFYKREISPLMPKSCRYVPSCSEYSMIAYKKYGVAKGTILTAWRLCRCNPLGGSGFDPPRWFGEERASEE